MPTDLLPLLTNKPKFRRLLLRWYDVHRRDLPWRRTRDPYRIWVSEIMLQQTRVAAVLEHYREFFERFPDIKALAAAKTDQVLAAWSGLGYYRRARNMHLAAQQVVSELNAEFPNEVDGLRGLPGIGRYTAAAIASIAFGKPEAVVDGNVERVITRLTGQPDISDKQIWAIAEQLLSKAKPGEFNQAMMELGATVCLPREPLCLKCPVYVSCASRTALQRPKKILKAKSADVAFLLATGNGQVFLTKRPKTANLMPDMWELPSIARENLEPAVVLRHSILDTEYKVSVIRGDPSAKQQGRWHQNAKIDQLPLTGLARKILRHFELF